MENMAGFRSIKKAVIFEIPTIIIATPTGTDIPFLTKMQKRASPTELKLPFFNNKSSKNNCSGKVNIYWIMSTYWYHMDYYALLQNLSLEEVVKLDVSFSLL